MFDDVLQDVRYAIRALLPVLGLPPETFRTLGVNPLLGRTITPADDKRACPAIAFLSYDFWRKDYGGADDVVERRLTLDTHPVRIRPDLMPSRSARRLRSTCLFARKGGSNGSAACTSLRLAK